MKKFLALVIFSIALFSCSQNMDDSSISLNASAELNSAVTSNSPVVLLKAYATVSSKYGYTWYDRDFIIKVKNLAFEKAVSIHHKNIDGTWADIGATFKESLPNNEEIWTVHTYSSMSNTLGDEFVVKYAVNGTTYWDNNNGQNYKMKANDGVMLGNGVNIMARGVTSYYGENAYISFAADVRNLGYTKKVKVIYTTDNWASSKSIDMMFNSYYMIGYSYQPSPNTFGSENWSGSTYLTGSPASVQYYFQYEVNGQVYYDSNFGKNYTAVKN